MFRHCRGPLAAGLVALTACLSIAQDEEVLSQNIIGYNTLAVSSNLTMLAMPFDVSDAFLHNVLGTNRVDEADPWKAGTSPLNADAVYFWRPDGLGGGEYIKCYLRTNSGPSGKMNRWIEVDTGNVSSNEVIPGQGFWVKNMSATSKVITVSGDVVMDASITNAIVPGLNLVSYPYNIDRPVHALTFTNHAKAGTSPLNSDQIWLWNPDAGTVGAYNKLYYRTNSGPASRHWKWVDVDTGSVWSNSVKPGQSFWYKRVLTNGFNWIESRPY